MHAAHRPVRRKLITHSDFILDGTVKIGEGGAEHGDQLFESRAVIRLPPGCDVRNAVRRQQLFHGGKIAMVEGFVKQ